MIGKIAASQAGWSGAELIVSSQRNFITGLRRTAGGAIAYGTVLLVERIAKPFLWVMVPLLLDSAIVPGAWNGFASDFDATRGEAINGRNPLLASRSSANRYSAISASATSPMR